MSRTPVFVSHFATFCLILRDGAYVSRSLPDSIIERAFCEVKLSRGQGLSVFGNCHSETL